MTSQSEQQCRIVHIDGTIQAFVDATSGYNLGPNIIRKHVEQRCLVWRLTSIFKNEIAAYWTWRLRLPYHLPGDIRQQSNRDLYNSETFALERLSEKRIDSTLPMLYICGPLREINFDYATIIRAHTFVPATAEFEVLTVSIITYEENSRRNM